MALILTLLVFCPPRQEDRRKPVAGREEGWARAMMALRSGNVTGSGVLDSVVGYIRFLCVSLIAQYRHIQKGKWFMDISSLVSALIGGACTLLGAFGAIWVTSWLGGSKAKETKRLEKIEAIGAYMPHLKRWYEKEGGMYIDGTHELFIYDPQPNEHLCPFYEIENLVNWWLPELRDHVREIGRVVWFFEELRSYESARIYGSSSDMARLASDLLKYDKIFRNSYDHIWSKIGEEAQKAVSNTH